MRYYFLHPQTFKAYDIIDGRSLWEDNMEKEAFIVVKEVGPAMEHWEEAMSQPSPSMMDDICTALQARGYDDDVIERLLKKLQE